MTLLPVAAGTVGASLGRTSFAVGAPRKAFMVPNDLVQRELVSIALHRHASEFAST